MREIQYRYYYQGKVYERMQDFWKHLGHEGYCLNAMYYEEYATRIDQHVI
jgi:hypothetical protein